MFGRTRDTHDTISNASLDEFFGDGTAADNAVELHRLRDRVDQVEAQINSQFTSLATYAQIAQEQVELARSEAKAATERSEQRVTSLIERERVDRVTSFTGRVPTGSPDITTRLDSLEQSVAQIRQGLDECRQQQKDLAVAITAMFDRLTAVNRPSTPFAPPALDPTTMPAPDVRCEGPIIGLALNG